jgi:hypothetical protein
MSYIITSAFKKILATKTQRTTLCVVVSAISPQMSNLLPPCFDSPPVLSKIRVGGSFLEPVNRGIGESIRLDDSSIGHLNFK